MLKGLATRLSHLAPRVNVSGNNVSSDMDDMAVAMVGTDISFSNSKELSRSLLRMMGCS
jgi:hypothetical protein